MMSSDEDSRVERKTDEKAKRPLMGKLGAYQGVPTKRNVGAEDIDSEAPVPAATSPGTPTIVQRSRQTIAKSRQVPWGGPSVRGRTPSQIVEVRNLLRQRTDTASAKSERGPNSIATASNIMCSGKEVSQERPKISAHTCTGCGRASCKDCQKARPYFRTFGMDLKSPTSLAGAGYQFDPPRFLKTEEYPARLIVGDGSTSEEMSLDDVERDATTAPDPAPGGQASETETKVMMDPDPSEGESCYPPSLHVPSLDEHNDQTTTEGTPSEPEFLSNESTYGGSSEDGWGSDTETCAASVTSSTGSFFMVDRCHDTISFQTSSGINGGKGDAPSQSAYSRRARDSGGPSGQKRSGEDDTDDDVDGHWKRPKNNPPGGHLSEDDEDVEKRFACPYYSNNPEAHPKCRTWSHPSVSRVKAHALRTHLKPLQCARCGKYRAGDDGQIKKHLRDVNCQKPAEFIAVDEAIVQKGKDLKKGSKKAVTWKQVYIVLFECADHEVPSPYVKLNDTLVSAQETVVGTPIQTPAPMTPNQSFRGNDLTDDSFQKFAEEHLTRTLAQQLPRLIASQIPQIIRDYQVHARTSSEAGPNPQTTELETPLQMGFYPSASTEMYQPDHVVPPRVPSPSESPETKLAAHFLPQELPSQPNSCNQMATSMPTLRPTDMGTHFHPFHGDEFEFVGAFAQEDDMDMNSYLQGEYADM